MNRFLSIALKAESFHEDLSLKIPAINVDEVGDTYFLLKDTKYSKQCEGYDKVKDVLVEMLETWIIKIENIQNNETIFLPLYFWDECIGCIKVELFKNYELQIQYGYTTKIFGMSINPSQIEHFVITEQDFKPDSDLSLFLSKENFIDSIKENIEEILNWLED